MVPNVKASGTVASGGAVNDGAGNVVTPPPSVTNPPNAATNSVAYVVSGIKAKKAKSLKKVTVTWNKDTRVTDYYLFRRTGLGNYVKIAVLKENQYIDNNVKPGKTYSYYVSAYDTAVERTGPVARLSLKPGEVKGLKAKKIRGGVSLKWKKTKNVSGYQVQMKFFVKGFKTSYNHVKFTTKRKFKRKMLVKGRKFGFRIRAYKKVNGKRIYGKFKTITKRAG